MRKIIPLLLILAVVLLPINAQGKEPAADPHKGDPGGKIAAQIEEALRNGEDPSRFVNVQSNQETPASQTADAPAEAGGYMCMQPLYESGISVEVYAKLYAHALKWYNYSWALQRDFGYFEAYLAYAVNGETGNYYKYGHSKKMALDTYLMMIITNNQMPYPR